MSRYSSSEEWLKRAEVTIPLGSQTFSKSRTTYPVGISPLFAKKAKDAYLWDIDDNKYIDYVSSLASVTLGYSNKEFTQHIKKQLKKGTIYSLPAKLETEVAEMLVQLIPSAEMVRFGKNGSDATAAAIRLARSFTGKDHILVCGYHGWQDWYIGSTTRNKGVPQNVSSLVHKFEFNNIESLEILFENFTNKIAAVIMEPMNISFPKQGFLENVQKITNKNNALLIFDETITGFRYSKGGAQELFGITPDLSTFGKGLANGFPLSAIVGRRDIMNEMNEIFFSGTFGGELLSLSAALFMLQKHCEDEIVPKLVENGENLNEGLDSLILQSGMQDILTLSGHATWKFLNWKQTNQVTSDELRTYFMQEIFKRGILNIGTHNITLSHTKSITKKTLKVYSEVLFSMRDLIDSNSLKLKLDVQPNPPLFKVR